MFGSNGHRWQDETNRSHLKDMNWQHESLSLPTLSERPFDILNVIDSHDDLEGEERKEETNSLAPESVATSVISSVGEELDYEEKDIWSTTTPATTTFNTLSWDTLNTHFPSFAQTQLAKKHIGTPFITEAPKSVFEPVVASVSSGQAVDQSDLVKSLIQVLVGSPSIYFYWHRDEFQQRQSNMRILGVSAAAVQPVIKELLKFATQLEKLEKAALSCKNTTRFGMTGVAFGCCLAEFLINVQQQIILLFENEKDVTILKVHQYVYNLAAVTKQLCQLCCIDAPLEWLTSEQRSHVEQYGFFLPFGVDIINTIYKEIRQYDLVQFGNGAFYRDICLSILYYISVPFSCILSKWLGLNSGYNEHLDDPYNEFFVQCNKSVENILKRFDIRASAKLPYFISDDLAVYIYRSGLSLQLLKKTTPNHPIFNLREELSIELLLSNGESDRYMSKIGEISKQVQAYNSGTTTLIESAVLLEEEDSVDEMSLDNDDDILTFELTLLDTNLDLKGDFLNTLTQLIQHQQQADNFIPTIDTITDQSYLQPIQTWCPLLNESFMSSFLHQFKLQSHLTLLFNHFLFGSAKFVTGLEYTLFDSISLSHNRRWPPRPSDINMALRDLLLGEESDGNVFKFIIRESKESSVWLNPHAVEALDFLQLNYNASYPLNIVITQPIISKYNRIFTFVLQLMRTYTVTKRMFIPIKSAQWFRSGTRDTISRYRFGLEQFISAVQSYVHDTAIGHTWSLFTHHVDEMQTNKQMNDYLAIIMEPHTFKEYHAHILDRILYQCFLKKSQLGVLRELHHVLNDIILFGKLLDDYEHTDLPAEDKLFFKCRRLFEQFQTHAHIFIKILISIEEKGYGRLGSLLNSNHMQASLFNDLYARHEAKNELDLFVKDLTIRLSLNGFYLS